MAARLTTIVGAPIDCSGRRIGLERMPEALRAAGLVERLGLRDAGDLPVVIDDPRRDPTTGVIGFAAVRAASATIRERVGALLAAGERPLVLGGCCTLLIGVAAALRDRLGRVGLAFVDGHLDCYDGRSSPTGEAADMDLAILAGHGPAGLIDLAGPPPLVRPGDLIALGPRDALDARAHGAPEAETVAPGLTLIDAATIRDSDPSALGRQSARRLESEPGRFWLHLDLDVLDQEVLPAVDYPMPDGLAWEEVAELVRPLARSPALAGADVTIYNPTLDPDGAYAREIVDWLGRIF